MDNNKIIQDYGTYLSKKANYLLLGLAIDKENDMEVTIIENENENDILLKDDMPI